MTSDFLLGIRSNRVSVLHSFRDITTWLTYMTACDREQPFGRVVLRQLKLQITYYLWFLFARSK